MIINSSFFKIPIINSIIYYDITDSTNDKAKEFGKGKGVHGTLFVAQTQTAGKGRLGRSFDSPDSEGLYISLLLRPEMDISRYPQLTILAAVAVSRCIAKITGLTPQIKWPNDILIQGKKCAGILTEAGPDYVVIGIGLNVNNKFFPANIMKTATSLAMESSIDYNKELLLKCLLEEFNELYYDLINHKDLSFLIDEYTALLCSLNNYVYAIPHNISLTTNNPYTVSTEGLTPIFCKGIDTAGNLICMDKNGNSLTVNSGEVSIRGIHNYS